MPEEKEGSQQVRQNYRWNIRFLAWPSAHYPEKLENGDFTLNNASNVFRAHYAGETWNATNTKHFGFVFAEDSVRKIPHHLDVIVSEELRFQIFFRWHLFKMKSRRSRDGLVWTVSRTWCGRDIGFCRTTTKKTRATTVATENCLQRLLLNWINQRLTYECYDPTIKENNDVIRVGSRNFQEGGGGGSAGTLVSSKYCNMRIGSQLKTLSREIPAVPHICHISVQTRPPWKPAECCWG